MHTLGLEERCSSPKWSSKWCFNVEWDLKLAGLTQCCSLRLVMQKPGHAGAANFWGSSLSSLESHDLHSGCGELMDFSKLNNLRPNCLLLGSLLQVKLERERRNLPLQIEHFFIK